MARLPLGSLDGLDPFHLSPLDASFESAADPKGARTYDERATREAWEDFVTSGEPASQALVRAAIQTSWQRSARFGVDARGRGSTIISSPQDLHKLQYQNRDLLASSGDVFRRVVDILGDAEIMMIITDRHGVILELDGDRRTIDAGHEIRLEKGAAWAEAVTGTNGIGTALATGRPVHVHAAEHFCEGVQAWTCVGAPIRNPVDGSIIGLIDFSGPQQIFHRHNVALAVMAAGQIELGLADIVRVERMRLLETSLARVQGASRTDGVVILDRFGCVLHHNDAARRRWRGLAQADDAFRVGARLVGIGEQFTLARLTEQLPEEFRHERIEPLLIDGEVKGALLIMGARSSARSADAPVGAGTGAGAAAIARDAALAAHAAIVGRSEPLLQALDRVERAARSRTTILLEGETGVGKELFARLVHAVNLETGREPFVAFNCGAVSKELLGSELFGHAPGAFTGATRDGRAGRFEAANGGVISLDEIGEMPMELQPYLLRVLEERAVYRLGESRPRPIDVRLVASTNRDLKREAMEGRFRKDLYFRISVVKIIIPPLRERPGDVELLTAHFNRELSAASGLAPLVFDDAALEALARYDWPGNVRELRNLVEGLVLMATDRTVGVSDLPPDLVEPLPPSLSHDADSLAPANAQAQAAVYATGGAAESGDGHPLTEADAIARLDETARQVIEHALAVAHGNVSVAAAKLGVARSTLYRKLQQYRRGR